MSGPWCGTLDGYNYHHSRGEPPCDLCETAWKAEQKRLWGVPEKRSIVIPMTWLKTALIRSGGYGVGTALSILAAEGLFDHGTEPWFAAASGGLMAAAHVLATAFLAKFPLKS